MKTFLLYEPYWPCQKLFAHYITKSGAQVRATSKQEVFVKIIDTEEFDVLIFDCSIVRKLQQRQLPKNAYLIATTADIRLSMDVLSKQLPLDALLIKPINQDQYRSAISSALNVQKLE